VDEMQLAITVFSCYSTGQLQHKAATIMHHQ